MAEHEDILDGLEERLQSHAKAFESLLSLTPAQDYYGSQIVDGRDPSEQWKAKKQTKEEKKAAKKAKLDPANQKSVLDVMQERERKRKRELGMEDGDQEQDVLEDDGKRQKAEDDGDAGEAKRRMRAERRKEKRDKKKEKTAKLKAKREAKKAAKQDEDLDEALSEKRKAEKASQKGNAKESAAEDDEDDESDEEAAEAIDASEMNNLDMSGLADSDKEDDQATAGASVPSTAPSSPPAGSPAYDISTNHSTASSSSSIIPPSVAEQPKTAQKAKQASQPAKPKIDTATSKPKEPTSGTSSPRLNLPDIDSEALQERLRTRIEELRSKRKADGPEGKTPKSRQELLDQRRKKEEQRKAHKKELRRKAKEEEAQKQEERLRGSGSPLSTDIFSPRSPKPQDNNNFSFSRLAFEDGTAADPSLSNLVDAKKRKGPMDPKTALLAAENKEKRLSGYDAGKRADIAEKDAWLNAKKRAHGERVRDDTSLLKKALKRKEKQKGKSESEWKERQQAVVKGKEMKQKKRETNLAKRKEEKGGKGKKGKSGGTKGTAKGRPGFEGRFKA